MHPDLQPTRFELASNLQIFYRNLMRQEKSLLIKFKPLTLTLLFVFFTLFPILLVQNVRAQCQTDPFNKNQGLISTGSQISGSFGNIESICVSGSDAAYRSFKVPSFQDLENQFFTLNRTSITKRTDALGNGVWGFTGAWGVNTLYLQTGSINLDGVQAAGSGTHVVFIRQDLNINGNVDFAENDPNSGLVFIVGGNINIASSVTKVNAVLISSGIICTAYSGGSCLNGTTYTPQLTINGGLISLNKTDLPSAAIRLGRNLNVNNEPAEVIKKQPKYLYNLRGILTRDLVITTEDQHYPIDVPGGPEPSPSQNPSAAASCIPVPSPNQIIDVLSIPDCKSS
jgi:hypothetical protein